MRRPLRTVRRVVAIAAAATLLSTAACATSTDPTPTPSASSTAAFPVTVGSVTLATKPTHIVSLSPTATETLFAIDAGAQVVVGTSGLGDADYAEIDARARQRQRGVLACGNFAITAVLLQKFAEMAARYLDHFEIIDYAHEDKVDAPSGTARELAHRIGAIRTPSIGVPLDAMRGPREARGAELNGVRVHSLRLPGYVIAVEAIFGAAGQRLHLKHEASASAEPYVDGALLAIRKVGGLLGVHRGLDAVMDE